MLVKVYLEGSELQKRFSLIDSPWYVLQTVLFELLDPLFHMLSAAFLRMAKGLRGGGCRVKKMETK